MAENVNMQEFDQFFNPFILLFDEGELQFIVSNQIREV